MKHLSILFTLLWCLITPLQAQQNVELDKRNGFKDIKLGTPVDSIKGISLKGEVTNKEEQVSKVYTVDNPAYKKIGEVVVEDLELTAYKGLISIIRVVTTKDTRLMKGMEMALGKAEWDLRNEQYFWRGQNLILTFKSAEKDKIELTYTSFPIFQKMKEDKKKEVEDIADDF